MIKSYFKIAIRNLRRNKFSSIINIGGLAIGMAVVIMIALWIWDELSFNKYHKNYDRIAQVMWHATANGERQSIPWNPVAIGNELSKKYGSDFKYVAMSTYPQRNVFTVEEKKLSETGCFMDASIISMLSLEMIKGNQHSLENPSSIILSATVANTFFGNDDPIGKVMKMDIGENVTVSGVYKDLPPNSDFKDVSFIVSWQLLPYLAQQAASPSAWTNNSYATYVQLADNADINKVSQKISNVKKLNMPTEKVRLLNPVVFLQPMSKWHLYADFKNEINTGGRIQYIWMFGMTGIFVLLLACINFINLSTARSEKRAREAGIRKTIGSLRSQLVLLFLSESLSVAFFAFMISLVLVKLSIPFFNDLSGKKMTIAWNNPLFWLFSMGFLIVTGLLAGLYPAFYLSSFKPVKVLKGNIRLGKFASLPRKVLVIVQFSVSVILIISTMVVFSQVQIAKDRQIGYNRNGLLNITATADIQKHYDAIKDEVIKTGMAKDIAMSVNSTITLYADVGDISWRGRDPNASFDIAYDNVTCNYGKTIGWQIKQGRDFSADLPTDSSSVVLNESAAKMVGFANPVGEQIERRGKHYTIIGIVKDIVWDSPFKTAMPAVFNANPKLGYFTLSVKLNPAANVNKALSAIGAVFIKYNPTVPFDYKFVDEEYAKKFKEETNTGKLAGFFAALAIFISCLGLFGLASFLAEQRNKEISIRKVLGASLYNVWNLLSKDFITLIIISLLIAIPAAYYFMHQWLQNYEYRAQLSWWIFAVAGAAALFITLLTVSFQAIKAALANPTKSLRSE